MKRFLIPAAAAALLLASCVSAGGDAGRFVPKDAYAVLVAESPASLFRSAESFFREAGLDRFTDGRTLAEAFREKAESEEDFLKAVESLDLGRPIVLAVLPDRDGTEPRAAVVLWLPLKKDKGAFEKLRTALTGFEGEASFVAGYAALALEGPAPTALPAKTADLSRLSGYPADSVKAWINVEALRTDFRDQWGSTLTDAFRSSTGEGSGDIEPDSYEDPDAPFNYNERNFDWDEYEGESDDTGLLAAGILGSAVGAAKLLERAVDNLRTLDFAVGADGRGFYFRAGASVRPDRALGRLASAAGPARGIPFLKYLEADALMGGAASFDPGALSDFVELYVKALGMDKLLGPEYFDLLESSYAAMGADSAFSFDVSIDPDFLSKAERVQSPGEISELLGRSVSFDASGAGSLRDRELYRSALRRLGQAGLFGDAFRELLGSSGLKMDFDVSEGSVEGVPYDSIRVDLGGEGLGADPGTRVILDVLLKKLTVYAGYSKDRYFMALGDPAKLPPAVKRDGAARPISQDKAYGSFAATLPKDTRGVYYISLRKIFGLVAAFSKDKGKLPDQGLDRLYGYFAASEDSLETGFFLGAGDIRALVGLVPEDREKGLDIF